MAAPGRLDVGLDVQLNGTWTNAKAFLRNTSAVQITRGRQDLRSTISPSQATMTLDNRGLNWSFRHPASPWYGQLSQSAPCRLSVPSSLAGLNCYLRLETDTASYASTPDSAALQITSGILSVRVDCKITDWAGNHVLIAKAGATAQSWAMWTNGDGTLVFFVWDGSANHFNHTPLSVPYFGQRLAIRADYNIAAGTVTWFTAPTMAGSWTQLGGNVNGNWVGGVPASISAGTGQPVQVGLGTTTLPGMYGEVYEAQIWHTPPVVRGQASTLVSSTNAGTTTWGTNPTAGSKVLVALAVNNAQTVTQVKDNGATPTTFTLDVTESANAQLYQTWRGDAITLPAAGSYAVTATTSGGKEVTLFGQAYTGVATGAPTATAVGTNAGSNAPAAGPVTPNRPGALYFSGFGDGSSATETITTPAGFNVLATAPAGASQHCAGVADKIDPGGPTATTATWGLSDTPAWSSALAVYDTPAATLIADPVFTSQTPGATSFTDGQSNTWTLNGTSELSGRLYRYHGELAVLPKTASGNQKNLYIQAQAGGVLRRLTQAVLPANSAMYRAYVRLPASLNLAAYWPAEDSSAATQIAQAAGKFPMTSAGLTMASSTVFACSAALPVMNGASATALVDPNSVTWTDNAVRFLLAVPAGDDTNGAVVCQYTTQGTVARVVVTYTTGGNLFITGYSAGGTQLFTGGGAYALLGATVRVSAQLANAGGGNITWALASIAPGASQGLITTGSVAGTIGGVTTVAFGGGLSGSAMGHFSVQGVADNPFNLGSPLNAWNGETAGNRFSRLCGEESIPCRITGPADKSAAMGNQTLETIVALLQECEDTDQGLQTEPRQVNGLGYVTQWALCSQPAIATADFSQPEVDPSFSPVADDTLVINDVTVTALVDGSSARQILPSGPMSVLPPGESWLPASGTQTSPGLGTVIAATATVQPGTYTVNWIVALSGTLAAGDANNFGLYNGSTLVATSVNTATAATFAQPPVQVTLTTPAVLSVKAIAAGTSGAVYKAIIPGLPPGISRFDTQVTVNTSRDSQLTSLASWYLHVRTADDDRYPVLPFQLAKGTQPATLPLADIGSFVQLNNTPSWTAPGPVKQLVPGYTETIGPQPLWLLAFNATPETPYETGIADDLVYGRCDTSGTVVDTSAVFGAGSFSADTYQGPLWSTAAGDYPFDLVISGMTVTVSACSGAANPQTFTVSAWGVNGVTQNLTPGMDVRLAHPTIAAL